MQVFFPITILTKASSVLIMHKARVSVSSILPFLLDLLQRTHSFKKVVINLLVYTVIDEFNINPNRHVGLRHEELLVGMVIGS